MWKNRLYYNRPQIHRFGTWRCQFFYMKTLWIRSWQNVNRWSTDTWRSVSWWSVSGWCSDSWRRYVEGVVTATVVVIPVVDVTIGRRHKEAQIFGLACIPVPECGELTAAGVAPAASAPIVVGGVSVWLTVAGEIGDRQCIIPTGMVVACPWVTVRRSLGTIWNIVETY